MLNLIIQGIKLGVVLGNEQERKAASSYRIYIYVRYWVVECMHDRKVLNCSCSCIYVTILNIA